MTHKEFSSKGGKANKGTHNAKERARKGRLAKAANRSIPLDERSPTVARMEAEGKIKPAKDTFAEEVTAFVDDFVASATSEDMDRFLEEGNPVQPDEYTQQMPEY